LLDWGVKPEPSRELAPALQKVLDESHDRKEALLKTLQEVRDQYATAWKKLESEKWYALPETWELRKDIDLALEDIQNYVSKSSGEKNMSI
jgi:predicted HNH restriction endonuclease